MLHLIQNREEAFHLSLEKENIKEALNNTIQYGLNVEPGRMHTSKQQDRVPQRAPLRRIGWGLGRLKPEDMSDPWK